MTLEGVDFSDGRPGGAALVAAQKRFVCRYVPYGGYAKGLTAAEIIDYHAHGIGIVLVWEQVPTRPLQGYAAGVADAKTSIAAAATLGFPPDRPIYFGADFDTNLSQYAAIDAYFGGVLSVMGLARTGVYGEAALCAHLQAAGLASWFWQTLAWSGGAAFADRHLYQYLNGQTINGAGVDLDRAYKTDFGQWPGPAGDEMDAKTLDAASKVNVAAGGSVADGLLVTSAVLIPSWAGGTDIGLYGYGTRFDGKRMACLRVDFGTGGSDLRAVWIGADKVTPVAVPAPPAAPDTTPFSQADVDAQIAAALAAQEAAAVAQAQAEAGADITRLQALLAGADAAQAEAAAVAGVNGYNAGLDAAQKAVLGVPKR